MLQSTHFNELLAELEQAQEARDLAIEAAVRAETRVGRLRKILDLMREEYGFDDATAQPEPAPSGRYSGSWRSGDAILDVMRRATGPMSVDSVLRRLNEDGFRSDWNHPYESVKTALRRLTDSGDLKKAGRGLWVAAKPQPLVLTIPDLLAINASGPTPDGGGTT